MLLAKEELPSTRKVGGRRTIASSSGVVMSTTNRWGDEFVPYHTAVLLLLLYDSTQIRLTIKIIVHGAIQSITSKYLSMHSFLSEFCPCGLAAAAA